MTGVSPLQVFRKIEVKGFDDSMFETKQVFYASKDGTKVPMFILHRKVKNVEFNEIRNFSPSLTPGDHAGR